MPGALDANGIYMYAEDDPISPFSDFMNLGQDSISDALAALSTALDGRLDILEAGTGTVPTMLALQTSGTWTKPAHLLAIRVRMVGGGGAGGGANSTIANNASMGGCGSSGSYSEAWFPASALPSSVSVTVGAGGTGVSNGTGNAGGASSFGAFLTAPGGLGAATVAEAATHGTAAPPPAAPAAGVATSQSGDAVLMPGNRADQPMRLSNGTTAVVLSNGGADSPFAAGGRAVTTGNGGAGVLGSGGSGSVSLGTAGATTGGAGGKGIVIIEHIFKVV